VGFAVPTGSGLACFGGGADVLMLSELDGMQQSSGEAGDRGSGFAIDLAMGEVGQESGDSHAEIAGGDAISREEKRWVAVGLIGGMGLGPLAGVVEAEARMAAGEWHTATAAVGKGESTQGRAVLWANRGHGCLL
jgi:hypothetical protein